MCLEEPITGYLNECSNSVDCLIFFDKYIKGLQEWANSTFIQISLRRKDVWTIQPFIPKIVISQCCHYLPENNLPDSKLTVCG